MRNLLDYLGDRTEEVLRFGSSDEATNAANRLRAHRDAQNLDRSVSIEASYDKVFIRAKVANTTSKQKGGTRVARSK